MDEKDFQTLVLELIRGLKEDIRDLRADMLQRFEQAEKRMERTEDMLRSDRDKLDEVYRSRDKVKITFGWQWGLVSFVIAIVAAGIARVF